MAPVASFADGACQCGDQCFKFGEQMLGADQKTSYVAGSGLCGTASCKEFTTYDACLTAVGKGSKVETGKKKDEGYEIPTFSTWNKLGVSTPQQYIARFITLLFSIIGTIALAMMVYGGFLFMISANGDKRGKGMQIMLWAGLGVVVMMSSYALVRFVFESFR